MTNPPLCARRVTAGLPEDCTLGPLTNLGSYNLYIYPNPSSIPASPFTTSQGEVLWCEAAQRETRSLDLPRLNLTVTPGKCSPGLLIFTGKTREQVLQGFHGCLTLI